MKKYVKPDLFYENFELSQSVASGCKVSGSSVSDDANFHNGHSCEYDYGTLLFATDNGECGDKYENYEDYCYQTGSSGFNFFAS